MYDRLGRGCTLRYVEADNELPEECALWDSIREF